MVKIVSCILKFGLPLITSFLIFVASFNSFCDAIKINCLYISLNNSASNDPILMILGLFESSEPAEYGRQNLVKIGAMVIELLTFKVRHGKSDY